MTAAPASPYKGLAPFGESELDAQLFFGRERDREIVVANLIAARLTVSVRTVEGHLYRAGLKLGVSERTALADVLGVE